MARTRNRIASGKGASKSSTSPESIPSVRKINQKSQETKKQRVEKKKSEKPHSSPKRQSTKSSPTSQQSTLKSISDLAARHYKNELFLESYVSISPLVQKTRVVSKEKRRSGKAEKRDVTPAKSASNSPHFTRSQGSVPPNVLNEYSAIKRPRRQSTKERHRKGRVNFDL